MTSAQRNRRHLAAYEWGLAFKRLLEERGVKRGEDSGNNAKSSTTLDQLSAELGVPTSSAEKRAHVLRSNSVRRNLSHEQEAEVRKRKREVALELRQEDAKKWTQKKVAEALGVARETVRDWFDTSNGGIAKASTPDARLTLPKPLRHEIVSRVEDAQGVLREGQALQDIVQRLKAGIEFERPLAVGNLKMKCHLGELLRPQQGKRTDKLPAPGAGSSQFGPHALAAYRKMAANKDKLDGFCDATDDVPTQGEFLKYVQNGCRLESEADKEREEAEARVAIKKSEAGGVYHGDTFELAVAIPDESCPLIVTDPPYDRRSLPLFSQLGQLADRILLDGGPPCGLCTGVYGPFVQHDP